MKGLELPIDFTTVLRKRHLIKEILLEKGPRLRCRIAILGGSTTAEVKSALEVFLLHRRIEPEFYESEYGRFSEDVLFENPALEAFQPQIAYIHTTYRNIRSSPALGANADTFEAGVEREIARFRSVWERIGARFPSCTVIQNNFDLPSGRPMGNLEAGSYFGRVAFVNRLNFEFARAAAETPKLFIQDIQSLAADLGSEKWFDADYWFSYKMAVTPYACAAILGNNLAQHDPGIYTVAQESVSCSTWIIRSGAGSSETMASPDLQLGARRPRRRLIWPSSNT